MRVCAHNYSRHTNKPEMLTTHEKRTKGCLQQNSLGPLKVVVKRVFVVAVALLLADKNLITK